MNIIASRIERALSLVCSTSLAHQRAHGGRRRGTFKHGQTRYAHTATLRMDAAMKAELDALCAALNVERGVILRDAVAFYLGMAKAEMKEKPVVPTKLRAKR